MKTRIQASQYQHAPKLLGLCLGLFISAATVAQAPMPAVEIAQAESRELAPETWVPGTVVARHDAMIAAEVEGRLDRVAEVGDQVRAGDSLASIDDRLLRLQQAENKAAIKRIESDLAYQKRQIGRLKTLSSQNNTAKAELDAAEARRDMLVQDLNGARLALDSTLLAIDKAQVKAPFDGVVVSREMAPGEYTRSGQALVRLVNTELLEVSARAPISVSRHSYQGDAVRVRGDSIETTNQLRTLIPVGDERSRMIEVRVELEPDGWIIGEAVRVALANGARETAVAVPRDALVLRDDGVSVFALDAGNVARRVVVKTGAGAGSYIGVQGELSASQPVIVRGAENLRDGQEVRIIQPAVAAVVP